MSDRDEAAVLRELERRAYSRPRTPEEVVAARAAAAELARRRAAPPASPASSPGALGVDSRFPAGGAGSVDQRSVDQRGDVDVDLDDDDLDVDERRELWRVVLERTRDLVRAEWRGIAIGAVALGALAGILVAGHAALTAPPPAYAVLHAETTADDRDAAGVARDLERMGVEIVGAPHVFGEPTREPRLVVYRQLVSESVAEPCAALLLDGIALRQPVCASEREFRTEGLEGRLDDGAYAVDFVWRPDGTHSLTVEQAAAVTLDEIRALGIPALELLESGPTPADRLIWNYAPDTIAGPLLLAELDGVQYVGLLSADDDSIGRLGSAPQFCLWVASAQSNSGACTSPEAFAENGLVLQGGAGDATWLPSGELIGPGS